MDWIRENKQLATLMGVFLAAAVGVGVLLYSSYSSYGGALDRFNQTNNSLAAMKSADLFPSPENLEKKKTAVEDYAGKVSKLHAVLLALEPTVEPISETDFQAKLKSKIAEIKKVAGKGTQLPADFALAFPEYTGSLPKSAKAATLLSGYLDETDAVVRKFIEAGAVSIDTLERSPLPVEVSDAGSTTPDADPKAVVRRTLTTTVTLDQSALQKVLNALASPSKMDHFTAVRLLRVENEAQEGPLRSAMELLIRDTSGSDNVEVFDDSAASGTGTEGEEEPAAETLTAAKPADRDAVAVLGDEKLKVYLEIDLVTFSAAADTEEPAAK